MQESERFFSGKSDKSRKKIPKALILGIPYPMYIRSMPTVMGFVYLFVCLFVLGPPLWYMEAPRLGVKAAAASLTQPQQHGIQVAYVTIPQLIAMLDT